MLMREQIHFQYLETEYGNHIISQKNHKFIIVHTFTSGLLSNCEPNTNLG